MGLKCGLNAAFLVSIFKKKKSLDSRESFCISFKTHACTGYISTWVTYICEGSINV